MLKLHVFTKATGFIKDVYCYYLFIFVRLFQLMWVQQTTSQ